MKKRIVALILILTMVCGYLPGQGSVGVRAYAAEEETAPEKAAETAAGETAEEAEAQTGDGEDSAADEVPAGEKAEAPAGNGEVVPAAGEAAEAAATPAEASQAAEEGPTDGAEPAGEAKPDVTGEETATEEENTEEAEGQAETEDTEKPAAEGTAEEDAADNPVTAAGPAIATDAALNMAVPVRNNLINNEETGSDLQEEPAEGGESETGTETGETVTEAEDEESETGAEAGETVTEAEEESETGAETGETVTKAEGEESETGAETGETVTAAEDEGTVTAAESEECETAAEAEEPVTTEAAEGETAAEDEVEAPVMFETRSLAGGSDGDGGDGEEGGVSTLEALIQSSIREKFQGGKLTGQLKVILEKNNTYEKNGSDITIAAGNREIDDNFELVLSAEDAGEEGTAGEGFTVIGDNLVIKGIKVVLNSVVIAQDKKIVVQKENITGENKNRAGELVYNGVDALINNLTVDARDGAKVQINTGAQNDVISVTADAGAERVEINTGEGGDKVTATVSGGDFYLDTAGGNDNIDVSLVASGSTPTVGDVQVNSGGGNDTLYILDNAKVDENKDISYTESVWNEETQAAEEVTKTRKAAPVIRSGSGDDTIIVDVRSDAGNLTVDTGAGGDTVTVWKGDVDTGETFDFQKHYEPYEKVSTNGTAVVTLQNGDDNAVDRVTVFAETSRAIKEIALKGGKGASVLLKGKLGKNYPEKEGGPISRITDGIRLHTDFSSTGQDYTLDLTMEQPETGETAPHYNLTDMLEGKKEVKLYPIYDDSHKTFTYSEKLEDFTNYIIDKAAINHLDQINIVNTGDSEPLLSNLVLDKGQSYMINDDENNLHAHSISAPDLNVLMKGRIVTIDGTVKAKNIRVEATQKPHGFPFNALFDLSVNLIDMFLDLYENANIQVKESASLEAEEDVALYAKVRQSGNMLTVSGLPVNLKIADVGIDINGQIKAGSSVVADSILFSNTNVRVTKVESSGPDYDQVANRNGDKISVIIQFSESGVNVADTAKIIAGEDILLRAENDITLYADADGSNGFAVAGAFISSSVDNIVKGTLDAGNRVTISAKGSVQEEALATRKNDAKDSAKNNYIGLTIINQDVNAKISGAKIQAGGDVNLTSAAKATAKTNADADGEKKKTVGVTSGSFKPGKIVVDILKVLATPMGNFFGWVGEKIKGQESVNNKKQLDFEELLNKISAGEYDVKAVKVSGDDEKEHGNTSVSVKVSKAANGKKSSVVALIDAKPDAGYQIDSVYYRYLTDSADWKGNVRRADSYTYVKVMPNSEGKYMFTLREPNTPYEVIVNYGKEGVLRDRGTARANSKQSGFEPDNDLLDQIEQLDNIDIDDLDDGFNVSGLLDEGANNIAQDPEPENPASEFAVIDDAEPSEQSDKRYKLNLNNPELYGISHWLDSDSPNRLLTWQVNKQGKSLQQVYAGQEVRFVGNCEKGTELKKLTITYQITGADGKKKSTEEEVTADESGWFVFTVPNDAIEGTEISVKAEYGKIENKKAPDHLDESGALALAYVSNKSKAKIESRIVEDIETASKTVSDLVTNIPLEVTYPVKVTESVIAPVIIAGGKLNVNGQATTVSTAMADARKVQKSDGGDDGDDGDDKQPNLVENKKTEWDNPYTLYAVRATSTLEGKEGGKLTATNKKDEGAVGSFHPVFTINPDQDYDKTKSKILVSFYTKVNVAVSWPITPVNSGKMLTKEISLDDSSVTIAEDGTITYKPNFASFGLSDGDLDTAMKEGTTVDVAFVFRDEEDEVLTSGIGEAKYAVANPIVTQYNYLVNPDTMNDVGYATEDSGLGVLEAGSVSMGTVTYYGYNDGLYKYVVKPAEGYTINSKADDFDVFKKSNTEKLYASWKGLSGNEYKAALVYDSLDYDGAEVWALKIDDGNIAPPAGAVITINAVFEADVRKIELKNPEREADNHGTISVSKKEGKAGDTITVKANAKEGWAISGIKVTTLYGDADFREDRETGEQIKEKTYTIDNSGKVRIKVPHYNSDNDYLKIEPIYTKRDVYLHAEADIQLSDKTGKGYKGETITVTPSEAEISKGMKLESISVQGAAEVDGNKFTITGDGQINVTGKLVQKAYKVGSFTDTEKALGSIEPVSEYADPGDEVLLNIKPQEGYRAKDGSIMVTVTTDKGVKKVKAYWKALNQYAFKLVEPKGEKIQSIEITGKFEKGDDGLNLSLGVAASVNWVTGSNEVEIDSGFISAEDGIAIKATSGGNKAGSEAYAGYSSAKNAGAGALSIQVASFKSRADIRKEDDKYLKKAQKEAKSEAMSSGEREFLGVAPTETVIDTSLAPESMIHIGSGALSIITVNSGNFATVGDAANKKKQAAEGTGVGAGVVFSIANLETVAEIHSGVKLADRDLTLKGLDGETFYEYVNTPTELTGLTLSATQRMADKATAAAGASGGSAFVPVAVIDILNSETRAKMGRLDIATVANRAEAEVIGPIVDKTGISEEELQKWRAGMLSPLETALALTKTDPTDKQQELIREGTITDAELAAILSGLMLSEQQIKDLREGKMSAENQAVILRNAGWTADEIAALKTGSFTEAEIIQKLRSGLTVEELAKLKESSMTLELLDAVRAEKPSDKQKDLIRSGNLKMTGPVSVKASSESAMAEYNHELSADASASGGTAMGGAFIVSWMNNEVDAVLNQSVETDGDIAINAGASDALQAKATASAKGGEKGKDGSSDKQANHLLGGGANMAGGYGGMDRGKILDDGNNRQQLESPENSVAGAGAVILNMQFVESRAEIPDRTDISTAGKLEVRSVNRTVANIKANASTTKSNTGVGIGAALNIVTMKNIAKVGNGSIRASELAIIAEVADGPEMSRTQSVVQETTGFMDQLSQTIRDFIKDYLGETVYMALGGDDEQEGPVVAFIQTFVAELVKELNLEKVFAAASGSASVEGFKAVGELLYERLKAFPEKLAAPVINTYEQILGTFGGWDKERAQALKDDVLGIFVTQMIGNLSDSFRSNFIQKALTDVLNGAVQMLGNAMNGKGVDMNKIVDLLKESALNTAREAVNKTIDSMFLYLSEQLPLLSKNNARLLLELKENKDKILKELKGGVGNVLKNDIIPYVLQVFRNEVYDYEPIATKIKENGLIEFLKKEFKTLIAKSTQAMTNQAINMLVSKLNVKLPVETSGDRHVITTQAISGAGTTGSGGAGSLAIAVALLTTKAEIAGGSAPITVTGDVTLNAEEARRIRTHSSAAIDARGEPDNNSGDEEEEESGTTTKEFVSPDKKLTVKTTLGGSVTFDGDGEDVLVNLHPEKGYKVALNGVQRTFFKDGKMADEKDYAITVFDEKVTGQFFTPYENIKGKDVEDLEIEVTFEEDLHVVPQPTVIDENFQVGVAVEGRTPRSNNIIEAKYNDVVFIVVPNTDWHPEIGVQYKEGNETKEISLSGNPRDFTIASETRDETVYAFRMPDGDITKINVYKAREKTEAEKKADEKKPKSEAKDASGKTIGVGGAVSFTYGNSDVKAQIGTRQQLKQNADGTVTEVDDENARPSNEEVDEEGDGSDQEKIYKETGREGLSAGTLTITASSNHEEENFATGGTDPFAGTDTKNASPKDTSVDFSVSLNILDNDIFAGVAKGTTVTVTGAAGGMEEDPEGDGANRIETEADEEELGEDEPETIKAKQGDIVVSATEVSKNETKANAFATGKQTGVGISVAVNVSLSDVEAALGNGATAAGDITVRGHSVSKDQTWSMASSVGADVQRTLNKFADGRDKTKETINKLTSGEIFNDWVDNKESKKDSNKTSKRITGRLNAQSDPNGSKAGSNLSTALNVLRSQNIEADNGEDANEAAQGKKKDGEDDEDDDDDPYLQDDLNEMLGDDQGALGDANPQGQENKNKKAKLQLAATVGFSVGFHRVKTEVGDSLVSQTGKIDLIARNASNFRTRATAAAMSTEKAEDGGHDIAAAIGVTLNKNKALISMSGDLKADGDVTLDANLTQNLTDSYKGYLAVQSVSGAISGKGYDYSVAGALSLAVNKAEAKAIVKDAETITGDNVTINAYDKSKVGIRAGAINFSNGAAKGAGVSIGSVWSYNTVRAEVNDGVKIRANDFKLNAEKAKVSWDDFKFPFKLNQLISDTSDMTDEQRENVYTGLIDVHREPGQKNYTVDINVDSYALMGFIDNMNVLSSQNYYVETVAGSLVKGRAKDDEPNALNASGSLSIVRTKNTVDAILGKNVTIRNRDWTDEDEAELAAGTEKELASNKVSLTASGDTNGRLIAGAISVGSAKNSAGISLNFQINSDEVNLKAGEGLDIRAGGDVKIAASGDTRIQTINAAAAASTEEEAKYTMGGGLNVLAMKNTAKTAIGDDARITSGALDIDAKSELELLLISASLAGSKEGTAAGGTVAGVRDRAKAQVEIGANQELRAVTGDLNIRAKVVDKMMSLLASASAAVKSDEGKGYAGSLSVLDSKNVGTVKLEASEKGLYANEGSITVTGDADSRAVNATFAAAGGKQAAIGLNLNINFFRRTSGVEIVGGENYTIQAGRNVMTSAYGNDTSVVAAMAVSASKESAGSGNLPIMVSRNTIYNTIGSANIIAGGEAAFASRLKDLSVGVSGSIAVQINMEDAGEGTSAGAGALFMIKNNSVKTDMGNTTVTADGSSGELYRAMVKDKRIEKITEKNSKGKDVEKPFKGVYVGSTAEDFVVGVAAGIVGGTGKNTVNANMLISTNKNNITADAGNASLYATNGGAAVRAKDDSLLWAVAGGLNVGYSNSAGAALAVLTSSKNVKATGHVLHAKNNIDVIAENKDNVKELAVNVGASVSDEGNVTLDMGITLQIVKSKVNAAVASDVKSTAGAFRLQAKNNSALDNINVALAASRSKYTTTPVFALTYYGGETNALLGSGTVDVKKGVSILADSSKDIDQVTIGASAGTGAALSGAASLMFLKDHTNALVQHGTSITGSSLDVIANSNYDLTGASVALAGSFSSDKKPGGSVNAMVTVAKSSTLAEMEGKANVSGPARIKATADRDIVEAGLAGGFSMNGVAAGVTVMVLVAGDKMDQDAANMLTYGSAKEEKEKVLDTDAVIGKLKSLGINTSDMEAHTVTPDPRDPDKEVETSGIGDDLTGNGTTSNNVKTKDGSGFDATSGYEDYDNEGQSQDSDGSEGRDLDETEDVAMARGVGTTAYTSDAKDSVTARVAEDAKVEAKGISVMASQDTKADLFGAAAGVSVNGMGGLGVSFGLALLRSNVIAASLGELDAKEGDITVSAVSTSGNVKGASGTDEEARTKALNEQMPNTGDIMTRSIRAVGLAVGVGASADGVGIAVAGGVVRTDNITKATLGGTIANAANITVDSEMVYDNVLATTVSLAGGGKGAIAGSLAISLANGTADARILESAQITGNNTKIGMVNTGIVNARALAVTAAGSGKGSVAAGVSVARNNLTQNTIIEKGASIDLTGEDGELKLKGTSRTTSETYLINVAIGGEFGVGIGLALSTVSPTINTSIGLEDGEGQVSLGKLKSVKVLNDLESKADSLLVSVAGGANAGVSLNGLLVFNDTKATAGVGAVSGDLGSLSIDSDITSKGDSTFGSVSVGSAAVGLSISYVDVTAKNEAKLVTDNFTATVRDTLTVATNQGRSLDDTMRISGELGSEAHALSISGSLGLYGAVGLNAAVARNQVANLATIEGTGGINAGNLVLNAYGTGTAKTEMVGIAVAAGVAVGASVAISMNEATSIATMRIGGAPEANLDIRSQMDGETNTQLYTGGGGLGALTVNVARSYGRTRSLIDVDIAQAPVKSIDLNAAAHGSNDVETTIMNQTFAAISAAVMVGYAYNQDIYSANVVLRGGEYKLNKANVTTTYNTSSVASVTPSASGVDIAAGSIAYNIAKSNSTAYVGARLDLVGATADLQDTGSVNVQSHGSGSAYAEMVTAKFFELKIINIAANVSRADYKARQDAVLGLDGGKIKNALAVNVLSITDGADAESVVGASGFDNEEPKAEIKLASAELNTAYAKEDVQATALIDGTAGADNSIGAGSLKVSSGSGRQTTAKAGTYTGWKVSVFSVGGFDTKATSGDLFYTGVRGVNAEITGDININAASNTTAKAEGSAPGSLSLGFDVDISRIETRLGTEEDPQTALAMVGDGTTLKSTNGNVSIKATNNGDTSSDFLSKTQFSCGVVKDSNIPTTSWYNTGVLIGKNSAVRAEEGTLEILSDSQHKATSVIDALGVGLGFNYASMMGENYIHDDNNIDVGEKTVLYAKNNVGIGSLTSTNATAKTVLKGGAGFYSGEFVDCKNEIIRASSINLDDGVNVESLKGGIVIRSATGEGDNIMADGYVKSGGLVAIGEANSNNRITTENQLIIGQNVKITAEDDITLAARATGKLKPGDKNVIEQGNPDDDKELPVDGQEPEEEPTEEEQAEIEARRASTEAAGEAIKKESDDAYRELTKDERPENKPWVEGNGIQDKTDKGYGVYASANVKAQGAAVWPDASAKNQLDYFTLISINRNESTRVKRTTIQSTKGDILVQADNEGLKAKAYSKSRGGAIYGDVDAWSEIDATLGNTVWVDVTTMEALDKDGTVTLLATSYGNGETGARPYLNVKADADTSSLFGSDKSTAILTGKAYNQVKSYNTTVVRTKGEFIHVAKNPVDCFEYDLKGDKKHTQYALGAAKRRCDFCYKNKGQSSSVEYHTAINKRAMDEILDSAFSKALAIVSVINSKVEKELKANRSTYEEMSSAAVDEIYATKIAAFLENDVTLTDRQANKARLWTNRETWMDVYQLPNATQIHSTSSSIRYVSEVLRGDVLGNGGNYLVDIITALDSYAFRMPVISIGDNGTLDFRTGTLKIPSLAEYTLYLDEVSGQWLTEQLDKGYLRRAAGDQDQINNAVRNSDKLPKFSVSEDMTADGTSDGWTRWWLGHTPETAESADETLIYLMINGETDEADAYRTSVRMIENGEASVDVSLYIFRDSEADRRNEEKYDILFYDTKAGERSEVTLITQTATGTTFVPNPLRIILRAFTLTGADRPGYSMGGHFFAMNDGTDGEVNMFEGTYAAVLDGNTFESDYIRIENVKDRNPKITIKMGQPIWAEKTGEDTAEDLNGAEFRRVNDQWYPAEETPVQSRNADNAA